MSQLLFRLSKLSSRNKNVFIEKSVRLFSTSPYLPICSMWDEDLGVVEGSWQGNIFLFDPTKEEVLKVEGKRIPEVLINSKLMGASQGWGFYSQRSNHNSVFISDLFNPLPSTSNTKIIPLPPLTSMLYGQTKVVWNVAMSSSSLEDEDCVVAIKFLGRQLSMCSKPGRDLACWTNKLIPFDCSENSNLMYSKKDERFYLPAPGGNYLCSWDLHFNNDPKFNELVFHNLPEFPQAAWEVLDSRLKEDHWVESPCGQSFLVRWYSSVPSPRKKHPIVMVFREDQVTAKGTRNMCYTEDIGDLCIFLSKSDPFCVVASSFPGLIPNSIYLMGNCFAVSDLTNRTATHFHHPNSAHKSIPYTPFWLPPFSI